MHRDCNELMGDNALRGTWPAIAELMATDAGDVPQVEGLGYGV